jgi:hypothetical protein
VRPIDVLLLPVVILGAALAPLAGRVFVTRVASALGTRRVAPPPPPDAGHGYLRVSTGDGTVLHLAVSVDTLCGLPWDRMADDPTVDGLCPACLAADRDRVARGNS